MDEMKRIDRVLKYKGSIVDVYDDVMQSPTGNDCTLGLRCTPQRCGSGTSGVRDGRILMVRQYR